MSVGICQYGVMVIERLKNEKKYEEKNKNEKKYEEKNERRIASDVGNPFYGRISVFQSDSAIQRIQVFLWVWLCLVFVV